jgi:putative restriction endonuclease
VAGPVVPLGRGPKPLVSGTMTDVKGFVAVTNSGWYEKLSTELGPKDANFWKPSPRVPFNLPVGTPFFFKLKKPQDAIAGFGYVAGFSVLPDWLAWDTFEEANGVESLEALRQRLQEIREGARIAADPGGRIGCSLIAEAQFFPKSAWVTSPSDWARTAQVGASYDLTAGEGLRIWMECQARAALSEVNVDPRSEQPRFGAPVLHQPRLGQGIFRVQVLDAYGRACAVTGEHSLPVLEAAHIKPYSKDGEHDVRNGLSLRTDLHRLFDKGYITVDEQHRLVVGRRLNEDFSNGKSYYSMKGNTLSMPSLATARPSPEALAWHRENVFLG